jgi:hypothetical protein
LHRSCKRLSHTEGLNVMETALRCVGHQEGTAPDDRLLLRRLRNTATKAKKKGKAVPLHAMEALWERGGIAPTHSRRRH